MTRICIKKINNAGKIGAPYMDILDVTRKRGVMMNNRDISVKYIFINYLSLSKFKPYRGVKFNEAQ